MGVGGLRGDEALRGLRQWGQGIWTYGGVQIYRGASGHIGGIHMGQYGCTLSLHIQVSLNPRQNLSALLW